ncbi:acetate--CoA ligase family protein [Streptomyces sp. NBC_01795]|uniref:acetate--CoA ligase family protein n=1 Tax=Streptomyces sp. NBC_01795 TaxID=2975943 RepID=UPI002DDB848A|nr:acetate--CoA ligase family protein [Streptomyces sp. NBC_01795]WSA90558.1 acetate--CoA ligase family protein [Streptomyces sp. NBC_01795]
MTGLNPLFAPRAIAVLGASATPGKLGAAMTDSLSSFPGPVMKVNSGRPDPDRGFFPTADEAAEAQGITPDLVVSCIPAAVTADALREAAATGARAALVCAGGFAEAGGDGALYQQALAEVVRNTGIRVLGPNTSGFLAPHRRLTASFVPGAADLERGPVAVVAASGGVNHALAFALAEAGVGLRLGVGLGNSLDVTQADVLNHLADDDGVRAVALHVETAAEGRRLTGAVRRLTDRVPVVALVVGRSDIGDFARSHTGALATSWRVTRTALRQAGAVLVDDERDLVDAVTALSRVRLPANPRPGIGLVTAQAGPGLLLTDDLRSHGIQVPPLAERSMKELRELLPALTYLNNPVDTGRPSPALTQVVERVSEDPGIDVTTVYGLLEPTAVDLPAALTAARTATPLVAVVGPRPHARMPASPALLVERMAPAGPELIVGVRRDPVFGPVLALGAGGTAAEILGDVSLRLVPLPVNEAHTMLDELAAREVFLGARGATPVDRARLTHVLLALSSLAAEKDGGRVRDQPPARPTRRRRRRARLRIAAA